MNEFDDLMNSNENTEPPLFEENIDPLLPEDDVDPSDESMIFDTDSGLKDGQNKCEKCGATDIALNPNTGNLRCNYCRHEQEAKKAEKLVSDISQLKGQVIGSGAQDIIADVNDVLTFKCTSCGAEVVIDTNEALQARCHWCRNTLSVNEQIPNGAVPDKVLPFSVKRADAMAEIEKFVGKRRFFALPKFNAEFTAENIMGVYLPYMVIDINAHAKLKGEAEHIVRTYTVGEGENRRELYDVDIYSVKREFDLLVEGMTIEANFEKLQHRSSERTNNIVNAIKPFDTDNSVVWDANYMSGYTSQKRDVSVDDLSGLVKEKAKSIALFNANDTLTKETRDVEWQREDLDFIGKQWKAAYLPVWLYSYQQEKSNGKKLIHYVAVNGRSKKAMGSVPLDMTKLIWVTALIQVVALVLLTLLSAGLFALFALLVGPLFFFAIYSRYRNADAGHSYVTGTNSRIDNLMRSDTVIRRMEGLVRSTAAGTASQASRRNRGNRGGAAAGAATAALRTNSRQTTRSNSVDEGTSRVAGAKEAKRAMANQTARNTSTNTANRSPAAAKQAKAEAIRNSTSSNATTRGQGASKSAKASTTTPAKASKTTSSSSGSRSSSSSSRNTSSTSRSSSSGSRSTSSSSRSSSSSSRSSSSTSRNSSSSSSSSSSSRNRRR